MKYFKLTKEDKRNFLLGNPIVLYKSTLICPCLPFKSEYIHKTMLQTGEVVDRPLGYELMYPHRLEEEPHNEQMASDIKEDKAIIKRFNILWTLILMIILS